MATRSARAANRHSRRLPPRSKHIAFVIDSGCTHHIHPCMADLINAIPCGTSVRGVDGAPQRCVAIGDMCVTALDDKGTKVELTLTGVRCVPTMSDSLLSVGQLWASAGIDCRFAGTCAMELAPDANGTRRRLPFMRRGGLYEWHVAKPEVPPCSSPRALAMHSGRASSHIHVMSTNDAARCMHRRLHAGAARIKALPSLVADAPASLSQSLPPSCSACLEANATRLPHSSDRYVPTYPGRLIHVDIAGPFV
eukprot:5890047-Pleurochrysis_carterae.AAC.1